MARTYHRDSRGRFAGGGGSSSAKRGKSVTLPARAAGGKRTTGGYLLKRQAVKDAKAKLAAKDPADQSLRGSLSRRSQKGAVTRAANALKAAQQGGRVRLQRKGGVIRPGKGGARKAAPVRKVTTDPSLKASLKARAAVLKQATTAKGSAKSRLLGIAARQAESASFYMPKQGRGNSQLNRASKRAGANYVRLSKQIQEMPKGPARARLQRRVDTAATAWMSLPKTKLNW